MHIMRLYFLSILFPLTLACMEPQPSEGVTLKVGEGDSRRTYVIGRSRALQVPLFARILQSNMSEAQKSTIELPSIQPEHIEALISLFDSKQAHAQINGKKFMELLENAIPLESQQALDILQTAEYLEYQPLLQYAAFQLIKSAKDEIVDIVIELDQFDSEDTKNIIREIRRQYYLTYNTIIPAGRLFGDSRVYCSVQELIDKGESITSINNIIGTRSDHSIRISSLEGLESIAQMRSDEAQTVLKNLDFSNGRISSLQPNQFTVYTQLYSLDLWGNPIETISEQAFHGLSALCYLRLAENNKLRSLPAGCLHPLSALKQLELLQNRIGTLDRKAFATLRNLTKLDLRLNPISLPDGIFDSCPQLEEIDLAGCCMHSIPARLLYHLSRLIKLQLTANRLTSDTLPEEFFCNNHALAELDLSDNKLTRISRKLFAPLTALTDLRLNHNQLSSLSKRAFEKCSELQYLAMGYNGLSSIHSLNNLSKLELLVLSYNHLERLKSKGLQLPALRSLILEQNPLNELELPLLTRLTNLNIENTQISKQNVRKLKESIPNADIHRRVSHEPDTV